MHESLDSHKVHATRYDYERALRKSRGYSFMLAEALSNILRAARSGQGDAPSNDRVGDDNNPRPRQVRRVLAGGVLATSGTEVQDADDDAFTVDTSGKVPVDPASPSQGMYAWSLYHAFMYVTTLL